MSKHNQIQHQQKTDQAQVSTVKPEVQPLETAVSTYPTLQRAIADPSDITPNDAKILQRTFGNQAVRRFVIQRKMTVGPVGDKYEQEADAVAKQVVQTINTPQTAPVQRQEEDDELQMKPFPPAISLPTISSLQRQPEEDDLQLKPSQLKSFQSNLPPFPFLQRQEEDDELQAKGNPTLEGGELSGDLESSVQSAKGSGQPLSDNVRGPMEQAFNADFSSVKVHTGGESDNLNRSLSARAFTSGSDVFFGSGEYNPGSSAGQELIAHELTHTIQQGGAIHRKTTDDNHSNNLTNSFSASQNWVNRTHSKDLTTTNRSDQSVIQRAKSKGGLEYTEEGGKNVLHHLKGVKTVKEQPSKETPDPRALPDYYFGQFPSIGDDGLAFFVVPEVDAGAHKIFAGDTNTDEKVLQKGKVKLENDVHTAEWIIEGHTGDGTDYEEMMVEIGDIFAMRAQLKNAIAAVPKTETTDHVLFTPLSNVGGDLGVPKSTEVEDSKEEQTTKKEFNEDDAMDELFGGEDGFMSMLNEPVMEFGKEPIDPIPEVMAPAATVTNANLLFEYPKMADKSNGSAQITLLYRNIDTITRITELNAMKFLKGDKVKEGGKEETKNQRDYLETSGTVKKSTWGGLSSKDVESAASKFQTSLSTSSSPLIVDKEIYLLADEVGTLKLMVLNDTIAAVLSRFDGFAGEAHQKNLLTFMPKAQRQTYVHALAGQKVPDNALNELWGDLARSIPDMIEALMDQLDLSSISRLDQREVINGLDGDEQLEFVRLQMKLSDGTLTPDEEISFKQALFGVENSLMTQSMMEVVGAYTQTTELGDMHTNETGDSSTVIRSFDYAGVDSENDPGAVFETRKEVPMAEDNIGLIAAALKQLLTVAENPE